MPTRSDTMKVSATVVAGVALVAITVAVLGMYLPSLLWAAVLAIAIWPTYRKLEERRKTRVWRKIVAPVIATTIVALVIADADCDSCPCLRTRSPIAAAMGSHRAT